MQKESENDAQNENKEDEGGKAQIDAAQEMETKYGARNNKHNLRPRHPRYYIHLHAMLESTLMTQHSTKNGIKAFGDAGIQAVLTELRPVHNQKVMEPKSAATMTQADKSAALQYLMCLI
jgi:hypothetical protein